jgi:hypothetical protein
MLAWGAALLATVCNFTKRSRQTGSNLQRTACCCFGGSNLPATATTGESACQQVRCDVPLRQCCTAAVSGHHVWAPISSCAACCCHLCLPVHAAVSCRQMAAAECLKAHGTPAAACCILTYGGARTASAQ